VTSVSKAAVERPGTQKLLDYAESGVTSVACGRLGRSLIDMPNTVTLLRGRKRSLAKRGQRIRMRVLCRSLFTDSESVFFQTGRGLAEVGTTSLNDFIDHADRLVGVVCDDISE